MCIHRTHCQKAGQFQSEVPEQKMSWRPHSPTPLECCSQILCQEFGDGAAYFGFVAAHGVVGAAEFAESDGAATFVEDVLDLDGWGYTVFGAGYDEAWALVVDESPVAQ